MPPQRPRSPLDNIRDLVGILIPAALNSQAEERREAREKLERQAQRAPHQPIDQYAIDKEDRMQEFLLPLEIVQTTDMLPSVLSGIIPGGVFAEIGLSTAEIYLNTRLAYMETNGNLPFTALTTAICTGMEALDVVTFGAMDVIQAGYSYASWGLGALGSRDESKILPPKAGAVMKQNKAWRHNLGRSLGVGAWHLYKKINPSPENDRKHKFQTKDARERDKRRQASKIKRQEQHEELVEIGRAIASHYDQPTYAKDTQPRRPLPTQHPKRNIVRDAVQSLKRRLQRTPGSHGNGSHHHDDSHRH